MHTCRCHSHRFSHNWPQVLYANSEGSDVWADFGCPLCICVKSPFYVMSFVFYTTNGLKIGKLVPSNMCAQRKHPSNLIRVISVCLKKTWSLAIQSGSRANSGQTAQMSSLIWVRRAQISEGKFSQVTAKIYQCGSRTLERANIAPIPTDHGKHLKVALKMLKWPLLSFEDLLLSV